MLRRTRPDLERPFRVPFSPVVPILSPKARLHLMANLSLETWLRFPAWPAIGLVAYASYDYHHSWLRREDAAGPAL